MAQKSYAAAPPLSIDLTKKFTATFDTTKGKIVVELKPQNAPNTVNNFLFLANDGFYNGTFFHRVIPNFMVQGGDPEGTGSGGPGYRFADEFAGNNDWLRHQVGSLAMANAGPNTNGSQFYITHIKTDWLDGKHTVFGQVLEGQSVVDAIAQGDVLNSVTITEA